MSSLTVTSATTMRIIAFCVLSLLGGSSVAMDETASSAFSSSPLSSSLHSPRFSPLVDARDQAMGGKRAYSYRYEYKRLPLYQFGLGKRWAQSPEDKRAQGFSFGLGKRTRQFGSFGLGKRSGYDDGDSSRISYRYIPNDLYESYAQKDALENYLQGKRNGRLNFGLGKRDAEMNDEMGDEGLHEKVPVKHLRENKYLFGLGKRFYQEEEDEDEDSPV